MSTPIMNTVRPHVHQKGTPVTTTGAKVQQLRRSLGLSIRGLAKQADVSVAYLSKIEKGDANPTVGLLSKLADALGVPVDDLLESSTAPQAERPLPPSLQRFIESTRDKYPELNQGDWQKVLADVRFRGKYPETDKDWLAIFISMKNAMEE